MTLPKIGFGTYQIFDDLESGVRKYYAALESGYRLVDTAEHYNNHRIIGKINAKIIIDRTDLCIVTKLWRNSLDYKSVLSKTYQFLNELQTDYIDCLLIHWPNKIYNPVETFGALRELKKKGIIKSYGVSNYTINNITEIRDSGFKDISYNQVEFSPLLHQKDLYDYCIKKDIQLMSHSSLAGGKCLNNTVIKEIALRNQLTKAQVVYSWLINKNIIPITGLGTKDQIQDNFKSLHVQLTKNDINKLDSINENYRSLDKPYSDF